MLLYIYSIYAILFCAYQNMLKKRKIPGNPNLSIPFGCRPWPRALEAALVPVGCVCSSVEHPPVPAGGMLLTECQQGNRCAGILGQRNDSKGHEEKEEKAAQGVETLAVSLLCAADVWRSRSSPGMRNRLFPRQAGSAGGPMGKSGLCNDFQMTSHPKCAVVVWICAHTSRSFHRKSEDLL